MSLSPWMLNNKQLPSGLQQPDWTTHREREREMMSPQNKIKLVNSWKCYLDAFWALCNTAVLCALCVTWPMISQFRALVIITHESPTDVYSEELHTINNVMWVIPDNPRVYLTWQLPLRHGHLSHVHMRVSHTLKHTQTRPLFNLYSQRQKHTLAVIRWSYT